MKQAAISLAAIGLLALAANQACAQRAGSHSTPTRVTAGHGIRGPDHVGTLRHYRQVGHYRHGYHGRHRHGGGYYGYGPVIVPHRYVPRYVPRHPAVVVPCHRYCRPYRHYYHRPYRGFSYYGPGISIGIGF